MVLIQIRILHGREATGLNHGTSSPNSRDVWIVARDAFVLPLTIVNIKSRDTYDISIIILLVLI